jgi:hypothetical protein
MPLRCLAAVLTLLPLAAGCGKNRPLELGGAVTYQGQPVQKGRITFLPADGNGPATAAVIADGKYTATVYPGAKRVQIEGWKVVGQRPYSVGNPKMVDVLEPLVPARYNEQSELKAEIRGGMKSLDFNLD